MKKLIILCALTLVVSVQPKTNFETPKHSLAIFGVPKHPVAIFGVPKHPTTIFGVPKHPSIS
jgi:hypothetical protein